MPDTQTGQSGPTYYGRPQLKAAPFQNWVVGGYIFLAGLSGACAILAATADITQGRRAARLVRRGRYLSLLAPTLGSVLLIYDLHTPKRFYNMFRVAKLTSPMSIGTWLLVTFSGFSFLAAFAQFMADRLPRRYWPRRLGRWAQVPAAVAGTGLCTYTSSLLAATSTPLWAAAPEALAVRFGSSSIASGAAALMLGERRKGSRRPLDAVRALALAAELAASVAARRRYVSAGVEPALQGGWGRVERLGATSVGVLLPLASSLAPSVLPRQAGSVATLLGSLLLRVSTLGAGDLSAERPEISLRFAQPNNLPRPRGRAGRLPD